MENTMLHSAQSMRGTGRATEQWRGLLSSEAGRMGAQQRPVYDTRLVRRADPKQDKSSRALVPPSIIQFSTGRPNNRSRRTIFRDEKSKHVACPNVSGCHLNRVELASAEHKVRLCDKEAPFKSGLKVGRRSWIKRSIKSTPCERCLIRSDMREGRQPLHRVWTVLPKLQRHPVRGRGRSKAQRSYHRRAFPEVTQFHLNPHKCQRITA